MSRGRKLNLAITMAVPLALVAVWFLASPDNVIFRYAGIFLEFITDNAAEILRRVPENLSWMAVVAGFYLMKSSLNGAYVLSSGIIGDAFFSLVAGICFLVMTDHLSSVWPMVAGLGYLVTWSVIRGIVSASGIDDKDLHSQQGKIARAGRFCSAGLWFSGLMLLVTAITALAAS